jgi:hypothetical protein
MADTLKLEIDPEKAARLRRIAAETGESIEAVAQRLLGDALADVDTHGGSLLSEEQQADLRRRLKNPGPVASPEEVESFFARFKA